MTSGRSEKSIQNEGLVALSAEPDAMVWRNNTGQAWQGEPVKAAIGSFVKIETGMMVLRNARPVKFGLPGSADVLGAVQGYPVAVEFKTLSGRQSDQQALFARAWRKAGGIYVLARSPDDAVNHVRAEIATRGFND